MGNANMRPSRPGATEAKDESAPQQEPARMQSAPHMPKGKRVGPRAPVVSKTRNGFVRKDF